MVRGLQKFKEKFSAHSEHYVLIGGTACTVLMDEADINFRATKDLDIVLYVEALDEQFVRVFWEFIDEGCYQNKQKSTGKDVFYRFLEPSNVDFPWMLELFSRLPDEVLFHGEGKVTPLPTSDEVASLSAILLDDDYYQLVHEGTVLVDSLPIVKATHLIPLKMQAWSDLSFRKGEGEDVDSKDISKHKNDVFRLYQLLVTDDKVILPDTAKKVMREFLEKVESTDINFKQLGLQNMTKDEVFSSLRRIYSL